MTPEQCKAARAMTGMSQEKLAELSKVAVSTIIPFEQRHRNPHRSTVAKLKAALEGCGVEFIDPNGGGPGVRLRDRSD